MKWNNMYKRNVKRFALLVAALSLQSPLMCGAAPLPPVTPGTAWEIAKPEDCGFDAEKLMS